MNPPDAPSALVESPAPRKSNWRRVALFLALVAILAGFLLIATQGGGRPLRLGGMTIDFSGITWDSDKGGVVKTFSATVGPIPVETAPELLEKGVTARYVLTSVQASGGLFYQSEDRRVIVRVSGHQGAALKYSLYDGENQLIGSGQLSATSPDHYEIKDPDLARTARIVIHP